MKNIISILFIIFSLSSFSQPTWVKWNGHIFLKQGNDSIYFGDDDILSTMPSILSGSSIKTINGTSLLGSGNIAVGSWGDITGTLSNQSDLQTALSAKLATNGNGSLLTGLTASQVGLGNVTNESKSTMFTSPSFTGTPTGITAAHVGLGNVTNESKSTMFTSPTFTGSVSGITAGMVGLGNVTNESKSTMFTNPTFTGTTSGITSAMVGLGNVNNTSDANKPISSATQTALDAKLATNGNGSALTGLTKSQVGLANADNTSDANKPVSTATQTALDGKQATLVSATNIKTINGATVLGSGDLVVSGSAAFSSITGQPTDNANLTTALNLKANLASPTFTGTVTMPAGTIGVPVYARVTGSNATTTGQSLVNITGLSVPLVINATYEFEAVLSVSTSAVTTGTAYGVNYSVAGGAVEAHITGSSTSTASKTLRINALNTATTLYLATSAQTGGIRINGIVTTGANAGNFTVSHLKLTSGTSTVFINSYLKVTRIL